ncbi:MAG: hypothetical protein ABSG61_10610 [Gemmatimonadales bacterium]|jgi:hypothetical protein
MRRVVLVTSLAAMLSGAARAQVGPPADSTLTSIAIGGVRVCQPLDSVNVLYPEARDTMLFGVGSGIRWPGKIVTLGKGQWLFVEASFVDRARVWRITTTSPAFVTASGLRVGSSFADVLATRERMTFSFPEGRLLVGLPTERISFQVDDSSAARFSRNWGGQASPRAAMPASARIQRILVSGSCRRGRPGT